MTSKNLVFKLSARLRMPMHTVAQGFCGAADKLHRLMTSDDALQHPWHQPVRS